MTLSIIWGFLECLFFSDLTGGWDLLFPALCDQDLLPDNNCSGATYSDHKSWMNSSEPSVINTYDDCVNVNITDVKSCTRILFGYDVITLRMVPAISSVVFLILAVPLGGLYDRYGTLITRSIAM